jgi:hypothetical protein
VADFFFGKAGGEIGEAGQGGDFEVEGAGLDGFEDGGHADGVGAELLQHANFGRGFVLRAERAGVNAFVQEHVDLARGGAKFFAQVRRVGVGEIEKFRRGKQGRRAGEVDVVCDHHPFAGLELWIQRAGGVCHDQLFDSCFGKDMHARSDLARRIAFVKMHTALGEDDLALVDLAEDETAGVAGNGWSRDLPERVVGNDRLVRRIADN